MGRQTPMNTYIVYLYHYGVMTNIPFKIGITDIKRTAAFNLATRLNKETGKQVQLDSGKATTPPSIWKQLGLTHKCNVTWALKELPDGMMIACCLKTNTDGTA